MKVHELKYCEPGWGCYVEEMTNSWDPDDGTVVCNGHYARKFVYECNITCLCRATCRNRVVQNGLTLELNVFWTGARGWGVRTLEPIAKGQFVVEYHGEICTNAETMWRSARRAMNGMYAVCLDADWSAEAASNDETALNVDGLRYGNVARFVNHRCEDANLLDVPVRIDHGDPRLYSVVFFAVTDIAPFQELTWVRAIRIFISMFCISFDCVGFYRSCNLRLQCHSIDMFLKCNFNDMLLNCL